MPIHIFFNKSATYLSIFVTISLVHNICTMSQRLTSFDRERIIGGEGYWATRGSQNGGFDFYNGRYPFPQRRDSPWAGQEEFLKRLYAIQSSGQINTVCYAGYADSRFQNASVGASEYIDNQSGIRWTEAFAPYYVERYNVKPSRQFYDYVMNFDPNFNPAAHRLPHNYFPPAKSDNFFVIKLENAYKFFWGKRSRQTRVLLAGTALGALALSIICSKKLVIPKDLSFERKYIIDVEGYWAYNPDKERDFYKGKYPFPQLNNKPWPGQEEFLEKLKKVETWSGTTIERVYKDKDEFSRFERDKILDSLEYHDFVSGVKWTKSFGSYYVAKFNVKPSYEFYHYIMTYEPNWKNHVRGAYKRVWANRAWYTKLGIGALAIGGLFTIPDQN